jgi:hypothetical protein
MTGSGRLLALAAALQVTVSVGVATAQTVIVRNAPPGSTVELLVNAVTTGSVSANAAGDARFTVKMPSLTGRVTEVDARIAVDQCGPNLRRVYLVERTEQAPAPGDDCVRKDISGLFILQRVTTLVVDVGPAAPTVWVRQGPAPSEWLRQGPAPVRTPRTVATGLVVWAGGSYGTVNNFLAQACGTVDGCSGKSGGVLYAAGVEYWFGRYLALEAGYLKPANPTAGYSDDTFNFTTDFDSRLYTLGGKIGIPWGPVRVYGKGGTDYHQATLSTSETINDRTVMVDDVEQVVPGGSVSQQIKTAGWSWFFGAGLEGWINKWVAIYGEGGHLRLKGASTNGGEAQADDSANYIVAGLRFHVPFGRR